MIAKIEKEIIKNWIGSINKPLVSVCTLAYNHEEFIEKAIDSFLMQETNFPFEIIIDEDCSLDNTAKIIKKYSEKYPNIIKANLRQKNVGMMKNGRENLKRANGKYIALCEGDDYWTDKAKLQIQIDALKKNKNYKMSFHAASKLMNNDIEVKPTLMKKDRLYTIKEIIEGDFHLVQTNTMVFEKNILDNIDMKIFNESPVGDVWIRFAASMPNGAIYINKIMSVYRVQSVGSWGESMQSETKFVDYISKMIKSIDAFDKSWNLIYSKELYSYKNKFIDVIIKTENISIKTKETLLSEHSLAMNTKNILLWKLIYKHNKILSILKKIKKWIQSV